MNMVNTGSLWRAALNRLDGLPLDSVSKAWLHSANLSSAPNFGADDIDGDGSTDLEESLYFTLQVQGPLARDVINTRWRHSIEDTLTSLIGQPVAVIVTNHAEDGLPYSMTDMPGQRFSARGTDYPYYDEPTMNRAPTVPTPLPHELPEVSSHYTPDTVAQRLPLSEAWENEQRANILMHNRLNPRYTFDAFIVGNSNRLAHAASLAVAEAPGESYNPLFLYGGVGLGKTHLLHAIGHQGIQAGLAVLYVSSEQFTNEIVNAIRYRTTEEFRAKYRSVDILLVDDIQFIAGKESTEEEFFHTFNSLYEMNKQIVICSDRPPKAIVSLEERLRSRFEWGLIADIQPPDLETRMAILRVKSEALHYPVQDDIIAYIAGRVQTNIRELEGCLNRLMAYQHLHSVDLTMEVARAAMSSLGNDTRESRLNIEQIATAVADYYHIPMEDMCGKQRDKHIVMPRQVAMYLMRQETQASLLEIGAMFGGRDHSTVLHACEKIDRSINIDPTLRREIVAIREQLLRE